MITETAPGAWTVHDPGQRPVEGVAVYHYNAYKFPWFDCEADGMWNPSFHSRKPCEHIRAVQAVGGGI